MKQVKENNSIIFYPWLWTCCIWSFRTENLSFPGNLIVGPLVLWVLVHHLICVVLPVLVNQQSNFWYCMWVVENW